MHIVLRIYDFNKTVSVDYPIDQKIVVERNHPGLSDLHYFLNLNVLRENFYEEDIEDFYEYAPDNWYVILFRDPVKQQYDILNFKKIEFIQGMLSILDAFHVPRDDYIISIYHTGMEYVIV